MQGILWGKKRDKQKEKNGIRTDVIMGLLEKRKCPGFIRGSKSVPVPSGQKGSHASPAFTGQLGSCRSIHTTEGTTLDLELTHVSKVMEIGRHGQSHYKHQSTRETGSAGEQQSTGQELTAPRTLHTVSMFVWEILACLLVFFLSQGFYV